MLVRLAPAALLLSLLWVVRAGTFDRPVVSLDARSFDKEVLKEDKTSMVVFYAPWCGHCKTLGPEFQKAASALSPIVPFYAVDCDEASNRNLCAKYDVKGFPTIKAFTRGGKIPPKDYQGERKAGPLTTYASHAVSDRVRKLKVPAKGGVDADAAKREVKTFLAQDSAKPHVLLIHPVAASVPLLYKSLSQRFASHALGYIRDADAVIKQALAFDEGEPGKARLLTWKAGASIDDFEVYQGALKHDALLTFLSGGPVEPHPSATTAAAGGSSAAAAAAPNATALKRAEERARAQKKWEEEERRDQERRAKLEAKRAAAAAEAAEDTQDSKETTTEATAADPEEARAPTPPSDGKAAAVPTEDEAADPSPEAFADDGAARQKDEL